jgi:hypothetical protein
MSWTRAGKPCLSLAGAFLVGSLALAENPQQYEITITNLTRGQTFTPVMVASHKAGVTIFELGSAASVPLEILAEDGATAPLESLLLSNPDVRDTTNSGPPPEGFVLPGASKTLTVEAGAGFDHLSLAAMLIPTNDGFVALNGIEGPVGNKTLTIFAPAYDAGTEANDELCASIPGPPCGGEGFNASRSGAEGFVHIHAGIQGIGDLDPAMRDWQNPVARITIRRIK